MRAGMLNLELTLPDYSPYFTDDGHGGVIAITRRQYDALRNASPSERAEMRERWRVQGARLFR